MNRTILLAAAMLVALAGNAAAATYYVDCDSAAASDSHTKEEAQNEATPWKTLWHAGWTDQTQPGDTVLVKGTNCPDPEDISPIWDHNQAAFLLQDGEAAGRKWTYFKAYPGHRPHIRFKPTKTGIHIQGSYIWIEGFEISPDNYNPGEISCCDGKGHSGFGIWITGGHHTVIRNCNVHHSPAAGIGGNWADYMTIENNTIWNNAWWSNCGSSGIHLIQPLASNIDFGATTVNGTNYRIVVANNRLYGNDNRVNTCQVDWPTDGNGIILDDFGWSQITDNHPDWMQPHKNVLYPHRTLIMNNLIYGNGGRGILAFISSHADILHNTVYNNLQNQSLREHCGALGDIACGGTDMRVFNNITSAQYKASLHLKNDLPFPGQSLPEKISYGNNLTYGGGIETDGGASDAGSNITQDPLLTAPSLLGDADFHLKKGSPAINKGSAANSVPKDFEGTSRPIGGLPDIGAYETNYAGGMCINPVIKLLLDGR
ncbi:right-handed parallel beta-helix repeat-containing protein [Desulfobulbus sp. F5]|nr:right-handed parallel beta-helix repeat-containing protein [Desulfobulbus sp. F5]